MSRHSTPHNVFAPTANRLTRLTMLALITALLLSPFSNTASAQTASKTSKPQLIPNSKKYRVSGLQPATGRSGSASLTARALLGRDGKTDVEATTGELDAAAKPPGNINKIQLKPLDQDGEAMYARNYTGLTAGGYFKTTVDDLARGKQVQVQANVGGIDPKRTDIVTVVETVKLRPDLAASHLALPGKAVVNTPVNISAVIREINADAGATANCVLYVDGTRVDQINGLWVDRGGTVSAAFTYTFTSVGAKQIEVKVENVTPGDYDLGNNTVSGSIDVVQPGSKMNYAAQVWDYDFYDKGKQSWDYYYNGVLREQFSQEWDNKGWYQGMYMYGYMSHALSYPISATLTESNDGSELYSSSFNITGPAISGSDGTYEWTSLCTWTYDPTKNTQLNLCTWSQKEIATGNVSGWTQVETWRFSGDVIYYSQGFQRSWNEDGATTYSYSWNNSGEDIYGLGRLPFGTEHGINLSITSGNGEVYTASPVMTLQPVNNTYNQPYNCNNWNNGNGWTGKNCLGQDYSSIGKEGYASDWSNP